MSAKAASWTSAAARADRVLIAVMGLCIAIAGAVYGAASAHVPAIVRTIRLVDKDVEYVSIPMPPEPLSQSSDSGKNAMEKLLAQHRCLAQALYYEARGEGEAGELAVAEVIFHRLRAGFANSICAVVYQGASKRGCQFSFACDGSLTQPKAPADWRIAQLLAARFSLGS